MPAYLVAQVQVDDEELYKSYTAKSPAIIQKYGGRFLARGAPLETLEGELFNNRLVIVEFPDSDAVREFYYSPEYQQARALRLPVSRAQFVLIDGL
jgi:uncharacterized protein (DUF1330 family)